MHDMSYKNWNAMSDQALASHIGAFVKTKRMEQNKTQAILAFEAGISRSTLSLLERGETVTVATLIQVLRVLDELTVLDIFTIEPIISPMALAKMEKYKRQRASNKNQKASPKANPNA
ncbi:MAG: helix-turn-helix transcriptional regulator [Bacteroidetes bacterium]|nr:helix-turn-helix transcriptional regulator [Bacteroidota bacterium]